MTDTGRDQCFERLAPEIKAFLERTAKAGQPPLSLENYGAQRLFIESISRKMKSGAHSTGKVTDRSIPGPSGEIPVRVYTPEAGGPLPMLLFCHGGGWVVGNLDMGENICLSLAEKTPCMVISVDYRLAPEHPFPAGLNDCYAALQWAAERGGSLGGDPGRIAVAGESAGANLVAASTLMSRERGGHAPVFQVLFYPALNLADFNARSHREFGEGFLLARADMEATRALYAPDVKMWSNPYVSPLLASDLRGLPPALVITSGCDPLRDDGEAYAKRLQDAGVPVRYICYEDMVHAFLYFFASSKSAKSALEEASSALRTAFGK